MNNTALSTETWRHEKKALLTDISHHELINLIKRHPYHFIEAYPERYVNNIYFDDERLSHYNANINGISYRTKLRLRWYGDAFGIIDPSLELKIKSGYLVQNYMQILCRLNFLKIFLVMMWSDF